MTWLLVCLVAADAGEGWPSCLCSKAGGECKVREEVGGLGGMVMVTEVREVLVVLQCG